MEATLFATLMSILNGGAFVGSALGGLLTSALGVTGQNFTNLGTLVLICNLAALAPLPLLSLVPGDDTEEAGKGKKRNEGDKKNEVAELADLEVVRKVDE